MVMVRKKHSGHRRPVKRGLVSSSRRDEIVEEIVDFLRPWKNHARRTIAMEVNRSLDSLPKLALSLKEYSDATVYRDHTKKIGKALAHLETLLLSAPGALRWNFFDPMPPLGLSHDDEYPLQQPMPYKSLEEMEIAFRARQDAFTDELKRLRKICDQARDYGLHPKYDYEKHLSAECAYSLMQKFSGQKITGSEGKEFRIITTLLYEAVSGQRDADLKRSCDAILKRGH